MSLTSPFFILALDRGSQYTAREVKEYIKNLGWKQSFSAVGKPGDNSWSESFFANLKKKIVHWKHFKTREEARQAIFDYIERYYNRVRVQERLNYLSPMEYLRNDSKEILKSVA
ncbi:MAG: IS3 family transposase [Clostridiaceae bacterium]|nr:IS3 family transposase [Clostridiaceae bacterium]